MKAIRLVKKISLGSVDDPTSARWTVIVVEDEYLIRWMIADELRNAGFQVLECNTADEAVEVLNAVTGISLIFSDVRVPGSMDGAELAHFVGNDFPAVPVVLTSAQPLAHVPDGTQFVSKPYDPQSVVALINAVLAGTSKAPRR